MDNSEDIIGTRDISDVVEGFSYKPMSLQTGSIVHRVFPYTVNI
jgi:hypothetical protein